MLNKQIAGQARNDVLVHFSSLRGAIYGDVAIQITALQVVYFLDRHANARDDVYVRSDRDIVFI